MVYSSSGLNHMSQTFHRLYRERLARGYWRDRVRPILINNWEATYFDFTEEKILKPKLKRPPERTAAFLQNAGGLPGGGPRKAGT